MIAFGFGLQSIYICVVRRDDGEDVVMSSRATRTGECSFWHTKWSMPVPLSNGAKLYFMRLNGYARQKFGYIF